MLSSDRLCIFTVREWRLWIFRSVNSPKVRRFLPHIFLNVNCPKLLLVLMNQCTDEVVVLNEYIYYFYSSHHHCGFLLSLL